MHQTTPLLFAAALGLTLVSDAQARDDRRHDHRPPHAHHHKDRGYLPVVIHHHHPARVVRHRRDWVAPVAVITLGGIAISAARHLPPARVSYSAPPPTSGNWYYCGSSGLYYPYTNACPEGWQAVRPR